eukprot:jgi/Psemu1/36760/gm1.36760_g
MTEPLPAIANDIEVDNSHYHRRRRRRRVLTVGDGDLSLSLALSRAYGYGDNGNNNDNNNNNDNDNDNDNEHTNTNTNTNRNTNIELTASVLESDPDEFRRVFPETTEASVLEELRHRRVSVLYGVDATQLHRDERCASASAFAGGGEHHSDNRNHETSNNNTRSRPWDLVSFHHPHLGESSFGNGRYQDNDEAKRAALHHQLLCHYLHSASNVSDLVHVCLTGNQHLTWNLAKAATLQNLTLVRELPDTKPFASLWLERTNDDAKNNDENESDDRWLPEASEPEPRFAAPRRYRNGKLGKHWLARYGYRHRRTEGALFMGSAKDANVSDSTHFVFAPSTTTAEAAADAAAIGDEPTTPSETEAAKHHCPICRAVFDSESDLLAHQSSPVRPPPPREATAPDTDDNHCRSLPQTRESKPDPTLPSTTEYTHKPPQGLPDPDNDDDSTTEGRLVWVVPGEADGKRLRWFLQHNSISTSTRSFTKRLAEAAIRDGFVSVNGVVARDSSRILRVADRIVLNDGSSTCTTAADASTKRSPVEIVHRSSTSDWLVARKPSGMRTKGSNTPGTLEHCVSQQEGSRYASLSALETSCQGLCVVVVVVCAGASGEAEERRATPPRSISVTHFLTVLVHGRVPGEWGPCRKASLAMEPKWRQKKKSKKRKCDLELELSTEDAPVTSMSMSNPEDGEGDAESDGERRHFSPGVHVHAVRRGSNSRSYAIDPNDRHAGALVEQHLPLFRKEGFPVVGDSFCKHEYSGLKRSIRNRIKDKLCIGCFRVEVTVGERWHDAANASAKHTIEVPTPDKLSARYWERFLDEEPRGNVTPNNGNATVMVP